MRGDSTAGRQQVAFVLRLQAFPLQRLKRASRLETTLEAPHLHWRERSSKLDLLRFVRVGREV
jgi:hypothetical protein